MARPPDPIETEQRVFAERIRRREPEAFAELLQSASRRAFALAYRLLGDGHAAEDAVQEAFADLWARSERLTRDGGRVEALLMTIVHRRAIDELRGRARRPVTSPHQPPEQPDEAAAALFEAVVERLTAEQWRARLERAVAALPSEQRRALELAYFDGLTQREIAERAGVPLGTVKSRLRLGLARLRDELDVRVRP